MPSEPGEERRGEGDECWGTGVDGEGGNEEEGCYVIRARLMCLKQPYHTHTSLCVQLLVYLGSGSEDTVSTS